MPRKLALFSAVLAIALAGGCSTAYAAGDLVAPAATCPQSNLDAPVASQEATMLCLVNYAREKVGVAPLLANPQLAESAADKGADIIDCESFSHYACGREFTYWMRQTGYLSQPCWHAGENLAWGAGRYGSAASIFRAWLRSPAHRANLLGDFTETGLSLEVGPLEGNSRAHVWTQHFGSLC